eukprot:5121261-Amphidinium_carterae.2
MFDGHYSYLGHTKDFENWYYDWYDDFKQENMVYGLHQELDRKTYHKFQSTVTIFLTSVTNFIQRRSRHEAPSTTWESQQEATRPRTLKLPLFQLKKRLTNTTSHTYHIATV